MAAAKNVVLVIRNSAEAHFILPVARSIAKGWGGQVLLLCIVHPDRSGPCPNARLSDRPLEPALAEVAGNNRWQEAPVAVSVRYISLAEVLEAVNRTRVDLLLLPWPNGQRSPNVELLDVLTQSSCDAVLVRPGTAPPLRRLLVALRGGPSAALALDTGLALASSRSCQVTVLHSTPYAPVPNPTASSMISVPLQEIGRLWSACSRCASRRP
jgi:hypothetical protein